MRRIGTALLVSAALAVSTAAQQPVPPAAPASPPQTQAPQPPPPAPGQPGTPTPGAPVTPPAGGRIFTADAGLILFPVKADKVLDFEKIMGKLKVALAMSEDPVRKEQAAGWKIFKALEPGPNNTVLYVFVVDPAVKGGDYAFWKLMYEAFPDEVKELHRLYTAASPSGQTLLNLQLVQAFGESKPVDVKKPD